MLQSVRAPFNPLEWQFSLNWQATLFTGLENNKLPTNNSNKLRERGSPLAFLFLWLANAVRFQTSGYLDPASILLSHRPLPLCAVYHEGRSLGSSYIEAKSSSRRLPELFKESPSLQDNAGGQRGLLSQHDNGQSKN